MRHLPLIKTVLLIVLVGASMALSELLWTVGWGNTGEVAYTPEPVSPQASVPTEQQVTSPYRIVLTRKLDGKATMEVPGTTDYEDWMHRLGLIHLVNLHSESNLSEQKFVRVVEFDFGVNLTYEELVNWVPGLQPSVLPKAARTVYLYQTTEKGPVMLGLDSEGEGYIAQTDLSATDFSSEISQEIALQPWDVWNSQSDAYIPVSGLDMVAATATINNPSILPLVHSFFVNPQALTSVQENKHTLLWTDGSRAVWWDEQQNVLTYADPNTPNNVQRQEFTVSNLLGFAKAHGGAAEASYLFDSGSTPEDLQWTLQPYMYGFPLLDHKFGVSAEVFGGHVSQYQAPVAKITPTGKTLVHVLGSDALKGILHGLMPSTAPSSLSVQLGYIVEQKGTSDATIEPAYEVSQSGMPLWVIDAVTGQVVKGMDVS